jgi:pimeloyl-ACP methyl ester carboxylesterase
VRWAAQERRCTPPRRAGHPGRPALWLVHALGDSSTAFEPLLAGPLAREFELLAPDWPSAGDATAERIDGLDDLAVWLAASVERQTPGVSVGFVGHSLGAAVAVRAVRRLDRVVGLFSIEGNLTAADAYFSGLARQFEVAGLYREHLLARIRAVAESGDSTRRDALHRYHANLARAEPESLWRIGRAAEAASRNDALGEEYRALGVPRLYYWSPDNTPPETQAYIHDRALRHAVFTGGHWPMVDQPEATSGQIRAFFEPLFVGVG